VDSHQETTEKVNQKIVEKFLKVNAGKGYDSVNIHGGEPTLLPEMYGVLDAIQKYRYPFVSLQTNGRLLKDMAFAQNLVQRGVALFVVSLHGKDAAMHDYFTQVEGSFDEALAGIRNIKTLGKKVRTNTVLCKQSYQSLPDIVNLSLSLDTDHINISNIHTTGRAFRSFGELVPRVTTIVPTVKKVIDDVVETGKVVTVEGFPPCSLGEYRKYMVNWDHNEFKVLFRRMVLNNYEKFMETSTKKHGVTCETCTWNHRCGGIYKEYLQILGDDEFQPIH
jgi:MoaA/NifB/PqqE/SkfB family radical SAM enzyme